jgi:hypothetical protein
MSASISSITFVMNDPLGAMVAILIRILGAGAFSAKTIVDENRTAVNMIPRQI